MSMHMSACLLLHDARIAPHHALTFADVGPCPSLWGFYHRQCQSSGVIKSLLTAGSMHPGSLALGQFQGVQAVCSGHRVCSHRRGWRLDGRLSHLGPGWGCAPHVPLLLQGRLQHRWQPGPVPPQMIGDVDHCWTLPGTDLGSTCMLFSSSKQLLGQPP